MYNAKLAGACVKKRVVNFRIVTGIWVATVLNDERRTVGYQQLEYLTKAAEMRSELLQRKQKPES
jgi:hypothetical protein